MNEKVIIWTVIVCLLVVSLAVKTALEIRKNKSKHIFGIASDEDLFYCPGDIKGEIDDDL